MSNVLTSRPPQTDAEWARDVSQRLTELENRSTVRVGGWVLSSRAGQLLASKDGTSYTVSTDSLDADTVVETIRTAGFASTRSVDELSDTVDTNQAANDSNFGNIFSDLTDLFTNQGNQQTEIDDVIVRLEEIEAAFAVTPAYVSDIDDMATAPRASLVKTEVSASGSSGTAGSHSCADAAHSHSGHSHSVSVSTTESVAVPYYNPDKLNLSSTALVDYTPIVVDREGVVDQIRWVCGVGGIFDVDAYYMALCVYNPATGNIEKAWDSGDISDATDFSSPREVEWAVTPQVCTPGQVLFIAHQQIAPGLVQPTRPFACVLQGGIARPSSMLLDASSYRTTSRTSSIPSSVALSSLTRINTRIPWASVHVSVA